MGADRPADRSSADRARDVARRAGRRRLDRRVVLGGRRHGCVHTTGPGLGMGADAPARHRDRAGVHPWSRPARDERGGARRGRAGPVRARHRCLVAGHRPGLERGALRRPVRSLPGRAALPAAGADRRGGRRGVPDIYDPPLPVRAAAAEPDGVILNRLAVADLARVRAELGAAKPGFETVARIFVCPTEDTAYARTVGRRLIATYLTVPAYAAFHRWLGRGDLLEPMWRAWAAGDRRGAASAVPDELVDALVLHGAPDECRAAVSRYVEGGVDTPVLALLPTPELERGGAKALRETLAALAPTSTVHSRE